MSSNTNSSQWQILRRDPWLVSCLTWLPVISAVLIWWIFSQGIARDLPIGVVDLERSTLSAQLVRTLDATPSLATQYAYSDIIAAKQAMVGGSIYGYVVIPKQFSRDIYLGHPPQVSVFYNSQFILVGKLVSSAVTQAVGTFSAKADTLKQLSKGNTTAKSALGKSVTIRSQITPLFNRNSNYAQFLVSGIIPTLWAIFIVVATIMLLAANLRMRGLNAMVGGQSLIKLCNLCAFYVPIFLLQGIAFLVWFYRGLNWPMEGSFLVLIAAQIVMVLVCIIMGAFFFFMTLDPARALSLAGAYTAPGFAFMGVTFPATDMNSFAQFWRSILPATHYMQAQISQVSYGASSWQTLQCLSPMLGYLLPFVLTLLLIRKQLAKQAVTHDAA
jgi:ABC-2 type transport system permease protein